MATPAICPRSGTPRKGGAREGGSVSRKIGLREMRREICPTRGGRGRNYQNTEEEKEEKNVPTSINAKLPPHADAIDELPQLSIIILSTRIAYGQSSSLGNIGIKARSAKFP